MVLFTTCVEPVEPEFNLTTGLITVEAIVSNEPGSSFVKIQESQLDLVFDNIFRNVFINDAEVTFVNTKTSEVVSFIEDVEADIYIPPSDFTASVGDIWELDIKLEDGRHYKSLPETIKTVVPIKEIEVVYEPKLAYRAENVNALVPGHRLDLSFDDPAGEKNYYYWNFISYEYITYCAVCIEGYYRNGHCYFPEDETLDDTYFTYRCDIDRWRIRYNEKIEILDDELRDGFSLTHIPAAEILLHTKEDILVEMRQFSISQSAYKYYKVLKDIVNSNSGFNAPPPAALVGNMYNLNNEEEYVLGRFTAAATSKATVFIKRSGVKEDTIEITNDPSTEEEFYTSLPLPLVFYVAFDKSYPNTTVKPEDWPD